jgi:hypothetical protein
MNQSKRFSVCMLMNHKWVKTRYPLGSDGEAGGFFVRCRRCGKENHDAGVGGSGEGPIAGAAAAGWG